MSGSRLAVKLGCYLRLTRLHKPIGIFLVLWPMLWALWLAGDGVPNPWVLAVFVMGAILMRSAGCVINDYADRHIDGHVERTVDRPLATGELRDREALALFAFLCIVSFGLVLTLNALTIWMSFIGVALAFIYPFTKRLLHWPQLFLGAAFGWAVPMAFAAESSHVPPGGWVLFAATLIWALVYDTFYAMVDREDDMKIGVKSTAIIWGERDLQIIAFFQVLFYALLVMTGYLFAAGIFYYLGLAVAAAIAVYHHYLARHRDREACFRVFMQHNWLGGVIFLGIWLDLL